MENGIITPKYYVVYFQCMNEDCNHAWNETYRSTDAIKERLDELKHKGCIKNCDDRGKLMVTSIQPSNEYDLPSLEMEGYVKTVKF